MKQRWGVIALVAVISFVSGGALLQRSSGKVDNDARLFEDVVDAGGPEVGPRPGQTDVAGQRQTQPAADGGAVDRRDHGWCSRRSPRMTSSSTCIERNA